jgi:protein TonB
MTAAACLSLTAHILFFCTLSHHLAAPAPKMQGRDVIRVSLHSIQANARLVQAEAALAAPAPKKAEPEKLAAQPPKKIDPERQPARPQKTELPRKPQKTEKPAKPVELPMEQPPKTEVATDNAAGTALGATSDTLQTDADGWDPSSAPSGGTVSSGNEGATRGIIDVANLSITKKSAPEYPMISRKRKDQGIVTLLVTIRAGRVESVEVERSSGHPPLDESAVSAVRSWEFASSGYGDVVIARIPFAFTLQ